MSNPETWTGPKAKAEPEIMRLGFPVMVNGKTFNRARPAMVEALNGPENVTVSRPTGPLAETSQETKADGSEEVEAPES